jgi:hypothetical protein
MRHNGWNFNINQRFLKRVISFSVNNYKTISHMMSAVATRPSDRL